MPWGPDHVDDAASRAFKVVISQTLLHVLAPAAQEQWLRQMAAHVAPGGCLLLSSFSESGPQGLYLAISSIRFAALGMDPATIEAVMAGRNSKVFSVDPQRLEAQLLQAGLEPPIQLVQILFNRLWLSRRCEGGATA